MWVRSQGKGIIVNCSGFRAENDDINDDYQILGYSEKIVYNLGLYSSKKQQLQILNEIQERINEGCPFVYQMPEDNENTNIEEE